MLECVVNISEGRSGETVESVAAAADSLLLDVHSDAAHNRSVLTLAGPTEPLEAAVKRLAAAAVARIDIRGHAGAHPCLGAVDVVPFVPLEGATMDDAIAARRRFASWAAAELGVPSFFYGPERSLPDVRRHAFAGLVPDAGPAEPHPSAGAMCVGARAVLVAFNVWLAAGVSVGEARRVAAAMRSESVRALGLDLAGRAQVSMNLIAPAQFGPSEAYDAVAALASVERAELVGLLPVAVLDGVPADRWDELDLSTTRTIEYRLKGRSGPAAG